MPENHENTLIKFLSDKYDTEIQKLDTKIDNSHNSLQESIKEESKKIQEQIDLQKEIINTRLDTIDVGFRGDESRVGIFEQIRSIKKYLWVLGISIALLYGFKTWGLSWDEIIGNLIPKIKQIEPKDHIYPGKAND